MSGPIVPPLEVTEVDGNPSGRPITKIIVSNGDLTISGRTATIDTSGSGGSPATPVDSVQFNSDPAGTFTGDAGFVVSNAGGGASTRVDVGNTRLGVGVQSQTLNHTVIVSAEGSGQITLTSNDDGGGTMADMQVNIIAQTATDDPILELYNSGYSPGGKLHLDGGTGDFVITSGATSKDLDLKVNGTGQVEVQNTTTNTVSVLSIMGNGTGDARLDMQNASKRVWVVCDENKKLKVQGGSGGNTFIFDVSSASGGITFPDSTVQTTAASGGGGNVFNAEIPGDDSVNDRFIISQTPPWGSADKSTTLNLSIMSKPMSFPFIAPATGDITEIGINLTTAATGNLYVAIYDSGSEGLADSLVCYATIDISGSTGNLYQTSITGADPAVTRGTQYWYSFSQSESAGAYAMAGLVVNTPGVGLGTNITQDACAFFDGSATAYALPPASFTSSYSYGGIARPLCSLKIA